jgi:hypothetical protein
VCRSSAGGTYLFLWGLLLGGLERSSVGGGGEGLLVGWVREMRREIRENEKRRLKKGEGDLDE